MPATRCSTRRWPVEEEIDEHQPAEDLLALEGMDEGTAFALARHGVVTREDLADLATDELIESSRASTRTRRALIMAAAPSRSFDWTRRRASTVLLG